MKKHRLCLISVAMMAAGCTTYQHPEPTQAKDALKQAMNEQQKQAAPLTALPKSVQSELLQLNRPQMPVGMPEKRLRIAAHDVEAVEFFANSTSKCDTRLCRLTVLFEYLDRLP
ncbi:hypothetical protein ACK355_12365, partial [Aeromonas veronii]